MSLDDVLGQPGAVATLRAALASERVHHAWVFQGPTGVGKCTAALAFAAELLRPRASGASGTASASGTAGTTSPAAPGPGPGSGPDAARDAEIVAALRARRHPDVAVITKELAAISRDPDVRRLKQTSLSVEVLREFAIEPAARSRVVRVQSPAGRVFIIDEAELINPEGQNALLKTLEEPPPGTVLVLVTSKQERLLPTVRSRCQRVAFGPLDDASMNAFLDRLRRRAIASALPAAAGSAPDDAPLLAEAASPADAAPPSSEPASAAPPEAAALLAAPPDDLAWVLTYAGGAPGLACAALRDGLLSWRGAIEPLLTAAGPGRYVAALGPTLSRLIDERVEAELKRNPEASKDVANRAWTRRVLAYLAARASAQLRARSSRPGPAQDAARAHAARSLDLLARAERQLEANVRYTDVLENFSVQLASAGARAAVAAWL